MKIYYKILLTTLPIGIIIILSTGIITTHYCSRSLTDLATTWLETRLSEALEMAKQQHRNLEHYGLEKIPASILQAKLDAGRQISTIEVGKQGHVFVINDQGTIFFDQKSQLGGRSVVDTPWFQALKKEGGTVTYKTKEGKNLAFYGYFAPWDWYVVAFSPQNEFFGAAQRIKPLLWTIALLGTLIMAAAIMLLTHRLICPLKRLTEGTRRVGHGDLKTMISVDTNDELGTLAHNFNLMTARLQEITVLRNELEAAVRKRTWELTEMNKRLARTERFAAAGQLATTVAHEINSPLQGIFSIMDLLKETLDDDTDTIEDLEAIEKGLVAIKRTVKNLMDLNRPGGAEKSWVSINQIIEDTLCLFNAQMAKNGGAIQFHLDKNLPDIFASPQLISQVLVNLVNNALEALIEENQDSPCHARAKVPEISVRAFRKNNFIAIHFQDNGPGIKEEAFSQLFNPFYTTKKKLGMGVGLSICSESIQQHGGTLEAANAPSGGALFIITLPITGSRSPEADPPDNFHGSPENSGK